MHEVVSVPLWPPHSPLEPLTEYRHCSMDRWYRRGIEDHRQYTSAPSVPTVTNDRCSRRIELPEERYCGRCA